MQLKDITQFDFVEFDGYRYKISAKKALNEFTFKAVLQTLENNGYELYRLFEGGYIYATEKQ